MSPFETSRSPKSSPYWLDSDDPISIQTHQRLMAKLQRLHALRAEPLTLASPLARSWHALVPTGAPK